jgi:predicted transposase YbfD/YdcC
VVILFKLKRRRLIQFFGFFSISLVLKNSASFFSGEDQHQTVAAEGVYKIITRFHKNNLNHQAHQEFSIKSKKWCDSEKYFELLRKHNYQGLNIENISGAPTVTVNFKDSASLKAFVEDYSKSNIIDRGARIRDGYLVSVTYHV